MRDVNQIDISVANNLGFIYKSNFMFYLVRLLNKMGQPIPIPERYQYI